MLSQQSKLIVTIFAILPLATSDLGVGVSGRECLTQCAGNWRCITNHTIPRIFEPCYILQYYTQQYEPSSPVCIGPCQWHKTEDYYWCAVNATDTDFCNPRMGGELVTDCLEGWECVRYIRAHSTAGRRCEDRCQKRDGHRALWCHVRLDDGVEALWTCAPAARFYTREVQ